MFNNLSSLVFISIEIGMAAFIILIPSILIAKNLPLAFVVGAFSGKPIFGGSNPKENNNK